MERFDLKGKTHLQLTHVGNSNLSKAKSTDDKHLFLWLYKILGMQKIHDFSKKHSANLNQRYARFYSPYDSKIPALSQIVLQKCTQ